MLIWKTFWIATLRKEVTIQNSDQPYGLNDKWFCDTSLLKCNANALVIHTSIIARFHTSTKVDGY
jgi:hypothetical protein